MLCLAKQVLVCKKRWPHWQELMNAVARELQLVSGSASCLLIGRSLHGPSWTVGYYSNQLQSYQQIDARNSTVSKIEVCWPSEYFGHAYGTLSAGMREAYYMDLGIDWQVSSQSNGRSGMSTGKDFSMRVRQAVWTVVASSPVSMLLVLIWKCYFQWATYLQTLLATFIWGHQTTRVAFVSSLWLFRFTRKMVWSTDNFVKSQLQ